MTATKFNEENRSFMKLLGTSASLIQALILLVGLSLRISPGLAQSRGIKVLGGTAPAGTERRLALVIGNKDYAMPGMKLKNTINDADDMAKALKKLGFDIISIKDADYRTLISAINSFTDQLRQQDVGLFYYSGHGIGYQNENYLVPIDAQLTYENQVISQCISIRRLLDGMAGAANPNNFVFLDACRSNTLIPNDQKGGLQSGLVIPTSNPIGSYIVFSTQPGRSSSDNSSERNGLFTGELLRYLTQPNVGIRTIMDQTVKAVRNRSGGAQVPGRYDELEGDFVFIQTVNNGSVSPQSDVSATAKNGSSEAIQLQLLETVRSKFIAQDYQGSIDYLDQQKGKINNPITDRMYGWAYAALGKNSEAIRYLNRFIATSKEKVIYEDYKYLGRAYGKIGTPETDSLSMVYLEKAAPDDVSENLYREIAKTFYNTKRYDKAASFYAKTIQHDANPENNDYLFMGLAYYQFGFRIGKDPLATPKDTSQVLQLKQTCFLNAASSFAQMIKRIEQQGKVYPLAYYYQGQSTYYAYPSAVSLSRGEAVQYYEKFIELGMAETDPVVKQSYLRYLITSYKFLAAYSLNKKDDEKAKQYFTKVLELDPNDADVKKALEGPKPRR